MAIPLGSPTSNVVANLGAPTSNTVANLGAPTSNVVKTWGGPSAPAVRSTPAAAPANDPQAAYYATIIGETRKQNALLAQQIAAAPRLVKYDTAGAAASALSEANGAQTPLYTQKLNDYLAKTNIARSAEQRHAGETITDAQDQLKANLAGNDITRTRTGEDTATKIGETNYQEGNYFDTSGNQADAARTALEAGNATSGLAESGIGQGRLDSQQVAQASDSNQQQHQFEQTKTLAKLFQTRTLADLSRSDELSKVSEGKTESRTQLNLADFLNTSNVDEQATRSNLELERQGAILLDSNTRQKNKANAFIASLVKSGARPQDIALAKQIYG